MEWYEDPVYIKMSDCEEIQTGHKWKYGDWLIAEQGLFQIGTASFEYDMGKNPNVPPIRSDRPIATIQSDDVEAYTLSGKLLWLPTQEDLQAVLGLSARQLMKQFRDFLIWITGTGPSPKYPGGFYPRSIPYGCFLSTFNQLWLAFVQKKLYSKVWNGEEWVEVKDTEGVTK